MGDAPCWEVFALFNISSIYANENELISSQQTFYYTVQQQQKTNYWVNLGHIIPQKEWKKLLYLKNKTKNKLNIQYTTSQKFGVEKIFYAFESLFCSPGLHLFDQKIQ